jgi:hypothetical protein
MSKVSKMPKIEAIGYELLVFQIVEVVEIVKIVEAFTAASKDRSSV